MCYQKATNLIADIRDIPGYVGLYGITCDGFVYSYRKGRFLKGCKLKGKYNYGYVNFYLRNAKGEVKIYSKRKLLAMTYLEDFKDGYEVGAKDLDSPISSHNICIHKDKFGRYVKTRRKVLDMTTGEVFDSLSALSRKLCGDNSLKGALSYHVSTRTMYRGHLYVDLD